MNNTSHEVTNSRHRWRFFMAGGFDQVHLNTGDDLRALGQLDQTLWVALACPTRGLELDAATLDLMDTDKDGRIRPPELLAAVEWVCGVVKDPGCFLTPGESLPLAQFNEAHPEGRALLAAARQILRNLGRPEAGEIALGDTMDPARIFAHTVFNGDGVVPPEAAGEEAVREVLQDMLQCVGGVPDRSGKPGVNAAKVEQFFQAASAYVAWRQRGAGDPAIWPLGEAGTVAAVQALQAVRAKVDDYFARCRLAAFDARAAGPLNREEKEYAAVAAQELSAEARECRSLPLARIEAGRPLPLGEGLNPAWAAEMAAFRAVAVVPVLGPRTELAEGDWLQLQAKLGPCQAWLAAKAGAEVERLGQARVEAIFGGPARKAIEELMAQDLAVSVESNAVLAVQKLLRFRRDLPKLLVNFVNFRDFYSRRDKAIFQAGSLYLDQRRCDLCLRVEDAGRHAAMAGLAGTYLAYCDCVRRGTGEKMQIVAAFTNGSSDNLMVGRNGVFYDRQGRDWDATITRIVDNPISLRQAFWAPYKKFVRLIEQQVAKRAAAAEAASTAKLESAAATAATLDKAKPAEAKKIDVGTVAALGVAVGSIGTALSILATGLMKIEYWQIPLVFAGLMLLISGPSVIMAWLKLRQRNLGPILDANGWAVNAKARINVPFGAALTRVARLPEGAQRDLVDPFAEKKSPWPYVAVVGVILWLTYQVLDRQGLIHAWTHGWLGKPAAVQAAPAEGKGQGKGP
ncbi:MAG: hypothetical protein N3J91_02965 [Verrucomicrobiae bacterium]|nr:hypothetical protein [Verrucomicrobiae bacterium]